MSFSCARAGVLYPYVIYPLMLAMVGRRREVVRGGEYLLRVAIPISAYNEERHIEAKVQNFLELDYPADRLEMWVGLNRSTDRTATILRRAANARVHLVERQERGGKTSMLNELVSRAAAEVFLFTDVNPLHRAGGGTGIGAALCRYSNGAGVGSDASAWGGQCGDGGSLLSLRALAEVAGEHGGWLAGALGPNYAIRAGLYEPLDPALINDLAHPGLVAAQGFRCVFREESVIEEEAGDDDGREFDRQTRMTAQGAYVL